jgi:NAD+ diphosphatase
MIRDSIYKGYKPEVIPPAECKDNAFWFVFSDSKLLVAETGSRAHVISAVNLEQFNLKPVREQYLGTLGGVHCYSAEVAADVQAPEGMSFKDLRSLFGLLDDEMFLLAGKAIQIVAWDSTHQYCGRCGARTHTKYDERAKFCPECGFISYPRISPAIIVAVVKDDKLLMVHTNNYRNNWYSVVAGFVEPGETLEECVAREVMEETGVKVKNIRYFASQSWPFPNSLMIAFTAEYGSGDIAADGVEVTDAGWFGVGDMPERPTNISISGELIDWFVKNHSSLKNKNVLEPSI